jgi:hypothetical protein
MEETINNYFYELFPVDNINSTHPYEYNDETGEEGDDENRVEFFIGDYNDEETCFRWYDCEYFDPGSRAKDICPIVSLEVRYRRILNSLFDNLWKEPFKKWFTENFDLPIKTIYS